MQTKHHLLCCATFATLFSIVVRAETPNIVRRLPPDGIEIKSADRQRLEAAVDSLEQEFAAIASNKHAADVEVFIKAVDFALIHNEFYNAKDVAKADRLLAEGKERLKQVAAGDTPWLRANGLVVRGHRSRIDGSAQPYGLQIPEGIDFNKSVPLYIWLHGRGDKTTDMHFIDQRMSKPGQISPAGAIVLHAFGRQCVGFKSAGEIDVWEAASHAMSNYKIDPNRIVLMGFSMGGAGAWHLGAHYASTLSAISPGAGFAETARYQKLTPDKFPPWYEQRLWGQYDVPNYTRNLFNTPVVAYSGENDKQIQAARVMEQAFRDHGRELPHIIGPGMGHKYHPDSLKDLLARMDAAVKHGRNTTPKSVSLQTQTLRYNRMAWVQVRGLGEHWQDSRVDASIAGDGRIRVTTKNITALQLTPRKNMAGAVIEIDGDVVSIPKTDRPAIVADLRLNGHWKLVDPRVDRDELRKRIGLQGPIDDAFMEPFLVVTPTGQSSNPELQSWIDFEQQHFVNRWRSLMRGELRVKQDTEVTDDDVRKYNIVAWGTPETNVFLKELSSADSDIPVRWTGDKVTVGQQSFDAEHHVPVFIYPRNNRYLVVNSGLTFREGHDRTNSLQNPKLPDWAILDIRQTPNDVTAGKVVAADFFNEAWQVKDRVISPESRSESP